MAERTTRTVSRGLERERRAENLRRKESAGCWAAAVARREDASGGRFVVSVGAGAPDEMPAASCCAIAVLRRAACRRRCGRRLSGCRFSVVAEAAPGFSGAFVVGPGEAGDPDVRNPLTLREL